MPCVSIPVAPMPPSIFPITLTPPETPDPGFAANLCCKILQFEVVTEPLPLPPGTINPATAATITAILTSAMQTVQTYLDKLPTECPLE